MKIMYNVKPKRGEYESDRFFTYGKEYEVIADYRQRVAGQAIRDDGFVVKDNLGQDNMVFANQVIITDDVIGNTFVYIDK